MQARGDGYTVSVVPRAEGRGAATRLLSAGARTAGEGKDERPARLVELRFFAGSTRDPVARALRLPLRSAEREGRSCQAWLAPVLGECR